MKKPLSLFVLFMTLCLCLPALALTTQEVESAARAYVPDDATLAETELDGGVYELVFRQETAVFDVDVDAATGAVRKVEGEYKNIYGSHSRTLTDAEIPSLVTASFPEAEVLCAQETIDDGLYEIEAAFRTPSVYGVLSMNAETGAVMKFEMYVGVAPLSVENPRAALDTLEKLKPGTEVSRIMLDEDDGLLYWEGEAQWQNARYEFELDAESGQLKEWESLYFKK